MAACSLEGSRPILLEVQALVTQTNFGMPRRTAAGADFNRVNLLIAVLEKRCRYEMSRYDAYVNIAGGMRKMCIRDRFRIPRADSLNTASSMA